MFDDCLADPSAGANGHLESGLVAEKIWLHRHYGFAFDQDSKLVIFHKDAPSLSSLTPSTQPMSPLHKSLTSGKELIDSPPMSFSPERRVSKSNDNVPSLPSLFAMPQSSGSDGEDQKTSCAEGPADTIEQESPIQSSGNVGVAWVEDPRVIARFSTEDLPLFQDGPPPPTRLEQKRTCLGSAVFGHRSTRVAEDLVVLPFLPVEPILSVY
ncbi:hypothetical protein BDP27DRAFT_385888 [Rhodocollybia butyracea]|uniref:Uncharacterized protein n=1 Tax=Rhodocollybia butyracea TaxID=206335 RepID=A0A9P5UB53_9AGAR|nr:hypothetical protein BDP27DRAFT_385888 [Rhodocollybia butyracea]